MKSNKLDNILFKPIDLIKVLEQLVSIKENKKYVAMTDFVWDEYNRIFQYAVLCDASDKDYKEHYILKLNELNSPKYIVVYNKARVSNVMLYRTRMTYRFLLDKYHIENFIFPISCQNMEFENYIYIKDFICYLAELQINNNKYLTYDEMVESLSKFLNKNSKIKKLKKM